MEPLSFRPFDHGVPGTPVDLTLLRPSHEEVAERARARWVELGYPEGRDRQTWDEAEAAILTHRARTLARRR